MVRTATASDVPALASVLARAFYDDPVARFSHPLARRRLARMRFWFTGRLRTLLADELVFCDEGAERGAALWAPPDRWQLPPGEMVRTVRLVNLRAPQMVAGFHRVEKLHPREPHFYLSVLGVDPSDQGSGVGSELMRPMLERCDSEGVGAFLESSKERNIAFYARHGFRVTSEVRFPGGPSLWLMWRDPR